MSWYIDSWAVRDGLAFASRRAPGTIEGAENTVFMSVPDLEPVPIGRIATALRATRSGFQSGLYENGVEVDFESLDQIRALVRRAYLLSGTGPAGVGLRELPGMSNDIGDDVGAPGGHRVIDLDTVLSPYPMPLLAGLADFLHRFAAPNGEFVHALAQGTRMTAEGTVLTWEALLAGARRSTLAERQLRYESEQGLADWYLTLLRAGVWDSLAFRNLVDEYAYVCPVGARLARHLQGDPASDGPSTAVTILVRDVAPNPAELLAMCPCPAPGGKGGSPLRLSDVVLALVAGNRARPVGTLELCAVVLAGVALRPTGRAVSAPKDAEQYFVDQVMGAATWVASEVGREELPPRAERLLARYQADQTDHYGHPIAGH